MRDRFCYHRQPDSWITPCLDDPSRRAESLEVFCVLWIFENIVCINFAPWIRLNKIAFASMYVGAVVVEHGRITLLWKSEGITTLSRITEKEITLDRKRWASKHDALKHNALNKWNSPNTKISKLLTCAIRHHHYHH